MIHFEDLGHHDGSHHELKVDSNNFWEGKEHGLLCGLGLWRGHRISDHWHGTDSAHG